MKKLNRRNLIKEEDSSHWSKILSQVTVNPRTYQGGVCVCVCGGGGGGLIIILGE